MPFITRFTPVRTSITTSVSDYLVPAGLLFYDQATKTLRVGDGVTLGGVIIAEDNHPNLNLDMGPIIRPN